MNNIIISSATNAPISIDSDETNQLSLRKYLEKSFEPEQSLYSTNMFTFNLDDLKTDEKERYHAFLKVCYDALSDFSKKKSQDPGYECCSYYINNSEVTPETEPLQTFLTIASTYKSKYNSTTYKSKYNSGIAFYNDLLIKNRKTIGAKSHDKYYEKMSKNQILQLLCQRYKQLGIASLDVNKSQELRRYYTEEYARESQFFPNQCELTQELLPLHVMADFIQFFKTSFFAFKDTPEEINKEVEKVITFVLSGKDDEVNEKIKRLATFLPLELFDITDSPKNIRINISRFRDFLLTKGPTHLNLQQYMLGLGSTLRNDFSYGWPHLFMNLTSNFDIKSPYLYCDWNLWFNLFGMFIFSYSKRKVFPLMFALPFNDKRVYNDESDSYSFVTSVQYSVSELFNSNRQFLGVHFIRYLKQNANGIGEPAILPIFTFKNYEAGRQTTQYPIYSLYDSREEHVFNTDFFIARIEKDEIFSRMGITHQEWYHAIRYYGLRTYIIGDDRTKLYLTRRDESDPDLQRLINLLGMKRVVAKIFKTDDELFRSFKIINIEDADRLDIYELQGPPLDYEKEYQLGGGKKTLKKRKPNKKINTKSKKKTSKQLLSPMVIKPKTKKKTKKSIKTQKHKTKA